MATNININYKIGTIKYHHFGQNFMFVEFPLDIQK